jgi:nucleotide-binding universal stress UspA family protein
MSLQSILFPVDFSRMSDATAPHARGLAEKTRATVDLLHVVPWLAAWYGMSEVRPIVSGSEVLRGFEEQGVKDLTTFREKWFGHIDGHSIVKTGAVAESIVETAKELKTGLIMMPTRGLGPNRPFLIGSTTAKVLHDASCPVWTSPHRAELRPYSAVERILVLLDPDEMADEYLENIVTLTNTVGATLHVLGVHESTTSGTDSRVKPHVAEAMRRAIRARIHEISSMIVPQIHVEAGPIGDAVKRVAERENCDLVLANRGRLQQPFGRSQTHIYEIVLAAPCPVLTLNIPVATADSAKTEHAIGRDFTASHTQK